MMQFGGGSEKERLSKVLKILKLYVTRSVVNAKLRRKPVSKIGILCQFTVSSLVILGPKAQNNLKEILLFVDDLIS